jgi:hypothetical protein
MNEWMRFCKLLFAVATAIPRPTYPKKKTSLRHCLLADSIHTHTHTQTEVFKYTMLKRYSFCLMVEASDHGYVLHTRRIHVTLYRIRIQHQRRLAILNQFSVLIYAVCHILPSFVSYQGCVVHRWVFGVPWYTSLLEWKYAIQFSNE